MGEGRTRSGRGNFVSCLQSIVCPSQNVSAGAHSTQKCASFVKEIAVRTAAVGSYFSFYAVPAPLPSERRCQMPKGLHVLLRTSHTGCFEFILPAAGKHKLFMRPLVLPPGTRSMLLRHNIYSLVHASARQPTCVISSRSKTT
jgi:hypothetical protein